MVLELLKLWMMTLRHSHKMLTCYNLTNSCRDIILSITTHTRSQELLMFWQPLLKAARNKLLLYMHTMSANNRKYT